jgi:hypothetical protein
VDHCSTSDRDHPGRPARSIGTVPPVGALVRLAGRIRANPWIAVAIAAAALLVAAWLGWAIYVGSDRGANEAIGVLIAWPALVAAALIVILPLVGIYLLIRPRQTAAGETASAQPDEARAPKAG